MRSYPSIPVHPLDSGFPEAFKRISKNGLCPACKAPWEYIVDHVGKMTEGPEFRKARKPIMSTPGIVYSCGGVWRQVYDRWEGRCRAKLTQKIMVFAEEA